MADKLDELLKQHRNRQTITDAAATVERLRLEGKTITEITNETGLPRKMVNAHMRGFRIKQRRNDNGES